MTQKSIIAKIRKLVALAEGSEGNEAEVAAKLATKLMTEHAISMAHLSEHALLEADPQTMVELEVGKTTWRVRLAWILATHCNVSAVRTRRYDGNHDRMRVYAVGYGHSSDLEVWQYLIKVAERSIQSAAKAFSKTDAAKEEDYWGHTDSIDRSKMTSFREGAVMGLHDTLSKQRESSKTSESSETALAVQSRAERSKAEMERANPSLRSYRGGVGGSRDGYDAGKKIRLTKGMTGTNTKQITG